MNQKFLCVGGKNCQLEKRIIEQRNKFGVWRKKHGKTGGEISELILCDGANGRKMEKLGLES